MIAKQHGLKKYIVRLSDDERTQLNAMIEKGKHAAQKLLKARILLKADASDAGPGWGDREIAVALDTSIDTVARTRQHLVEEGLEGALTPQTFACLRTAADLRWRGRGQVDRTGLLGAAKRARALDAGITGRRRRRTRYRAVRQR